MPIKPENKKLYPKNWSQIRSNILERAGNRCDFCDVKNHAIGYRTEDGHFVEEGLKCCYDGHVIKIVLTIAHLDHDPTNNDPSNLAALCQRCHNRYDREHRQANARRTRRNRKAIKELFD